MKIIENGRPIDGIPYPVEIWNADYHMWDSSIEELTSAIYAESEDGAIEAAKDFMLDLVYASDMNEAEQSEAIDYYSSNDVYRVATDNHGLYLYAFERYTDKGGTGTVELYINHNEAVRAAKDAWEALCEHDKNNYRRDVVGTFRVYAVSIPYADLIGKGEEAYTANPYSEYEEYEAWSAQKYEAWNALKED